MDQNVPEEPNKVSDALAEAKQIIESGEPKVGEVTNPPTEKVEDKPKEKYPRFLVLEDVRFQNIATLVSSDIRRRFVKFYKRAATEKRDFGLEYGAWLAYMILREVNVVETALHTQGKPSEVSPALLTILNHVLLPKTGKQITEEPVEQKDQTDVGVEAPKT